MATMFSKMGDRLQKIEIGKLYVPSGKLYCCDPFLSDQVNFLDRQIISGQYEINLWIGDFGDWGRRVALAELAISTKRVKQWETATYTINNQQMSGFEVDAGLACFMDEQTQSMFCNVVRSFYEEHPNGNYYDDVLASEFRKYGGQGGSREIGDWNLHYPAKRYNHNIAMFTSGIGDGFYEAHWALDQYGQAVSLIADLGMLETPFPNSRASR